MNVKELKNEVRKKKAMLRLSEDDLVKAYQRTFLKCKWCYNRSKVGNLTLVTVYGWDPNTGSPCGGFYSHEEYAWKCPKCGRRTEFGREVDDIGIPIECFKNEERYNRK